MMMMLLRELINIHILPTKIAKFARILLNKPLPPPRRSRGGGLSNVFILLIQKVSAIHVSIYCSCGEMFEVFRSPRFMANANVSLKMRRLRSTTVVI